DNNIEIVQTADDAFRIVGNGTTINDDDEAVLAGVTGDVSVDLRGGDDTLTFDGGVSGGDATTSLDGDLTVEGGGGEDSIELSDLVVGGALSIAGGGSDDSISLENVEVTGDATLSGGAGSDEIELNDVT